MSVLSMNCAFVRRGARNACVQFAAYSRVVLCPSFSMSGDMWAYWGRSLAWTSAAKSSKPWILLRRVPLRLMLSYDTKGLEPVNVCYIDMGGIHTCAS